MPDVIPFQPKTMRDGPFDRVTAPDREYVRFSPPRSVREWISEGQVSKGCEANGTVLPYDVVASLNRPGPAEYVVIGEERYSDGRVFLVFGISRAYVETVSDWRHRGDGLVWVCPDCDGQGDEHRKILVDGQSVKCPRDTRTRR